jgi:hypothetical protein
MMQTHPSVAAAKERRRGDWIMLGRAFIVTGIVLMVLAAPFAFFLLVFEHCYQEDAACLQAKAETGTILELLPYLAAVALVIALLALRFRWAQVALIALGIMTILVVFPGVQTGIVLPFVQVPLSRLFGPFLGALPAAAMWILGALLMLLTSRGGPRIAPSS